MTEPTGLPLCWLKLQAAAFALCQGKAEGREWTNAFFMPIWAAAQPRLLFLLSKEEKEE